MKNTQIIGKAKELEIASQLIREQLLVFFPFVDTGADLVVSDFSMERFLPIQVRYRSSDPALNLTKKDLQRLKNTKVILAFIIGESTNAGTWYIPIREFEGKAKDPKRRDNKIYITVSKNRQWLAKYEGIKGIESIKSQLKA